MDDDLDLDFDPQNPFPDPPEKQKVLSKLPTRSPTNLTWDKRPEIAAQCLDLWTDGLTKAAIGKRVGISTSAVATLIKEEQERRWQEFAPAERKAHVVQSIEQKMKIWRMALQEHDKANEGSRTRAEFQNVALRASEALDKVFGISQDRLVHEFDQDKPFVFTINLDRPMAPDVLEHDAPASLPVPEESEE